MNKRKNMSDEQLAAYLDKMIEKERKSFKERFKCFSCKPQTFNIESRGDDDYCVEEDFADDAASLEVLKVSQEALKFFPYDSTAMVDDDSEHRDQLRVAACNPMAGTADRHSAAKKSDTSDKKDGDDIIPMSF